jgi:two-component system LytT family response regulator
MSPDRLRLVIADDEPLARELVRRYAGEIPEIEVIAECASGDALDDLLARAGADVLLLDIQMPGRDVFDVLGDAARRPAPLPAVIFATAFDSYAVRAFDVNAVDYLIKPYAPDRFAEAIRRVRRRGGATPRAAVGLERAIRDLGRRPDRLLVPDGRRMVPVAVADIVWIKAEDDYARIHAGGRSYLVTRTLKELEARLDPEQFIRLHRSALVQAAHIREIVGDGASRYRVRLSDGTTVVVSRRSVPDLRRWML